MTGNKTNSATDMTDEEYDEWLGEWLAANLKKNVLREPAGKAAESDKPPEAPALVCLSATDEAVQDTMRPLHGRKTRRSSPPFRRVGDRY